MKDMKDVIGKAIVDAGFTWSDGFLRESRTVNQLVDVVIQALSNAGNVTDKIA